MDWAYSTTPRDEIAAATRNGSPDTTKHTHTVGREEDETTLSTPD